MIILKLRGTPITTLLLMLALNKYARELAADVRKSSTNILPDSNALVLRMRLISKIAEKITRAPFTPGIILGTKKEYNPIQNQIVTQVQSIDVISTTLFDYRLFVG